MICLKKPVALRCGHDVPEARYLPDGKIAAKVMWGDGIATEVIYPANGQYAHPSLGKDRESPFDLVNVLETLEIHAVADRVTIAIARRNGIPTAVDWIERRVTCQRDNKPLANR